MDDETQGTRLEVLPCRIEAGRQVAVGGVLAPAGMLRRCHLLELPRRRGGTTVRVRVRGDALADDGIRDGDYLVLDQRPGSVRPGRTVLADSGGCTVVRRVAAGGVGTITLEPVRDTLPFRLAAGAERVHGAVVGIMRKQGFERVPPLSAGAVEGEPVARRLRSLQGSLRSLRATYSMTRHPRLRRALRDEASMLRCELARVRERLETTSSVANVPT